MKIHILIPVHNNRDTTLKCLELLSKQTFRDFTVTVTDDGSTDGTYGAICEQFPEVTILHGDGDLWWTGAINMALQDILPKTADDDYVLTLNNDVTFNEDYLASLVDAVKLRPGWLIGSVSLDCTDTNRVIDAGIYFDWRTGKEIMSDYRHGKYFNDNINRLSGRGTLIPVCVFRANNLYNAKHLPHYGADYEFSIRAQNAGFNLCVHCNAVLLSDTNISGLKFTPLMKISITKAKDLLFSRKSVANVGNKIRFRLLCCPRKYFLRNILFVFFNVLLILTSISPLWHIKICCHHIFKFLKSIRNRIVDAFIRRILNMRSRIAYRSSPKPMVDSSQTHIVLFFDYEGRWAHGDQTENSRKGVIQILDILKRNNIKTTFNIVGKLLEEEIKIIRRINADGHEVASHTVLHTPLISGPKQVCQNILEFRKLAANFGVNISGFRSPKSRWRFKTLDGLLLADILWNAENDAASYPYVIRSNSTKRLWRLPVSIDDWDYKKRNILPAEMLKNWKNIVFDAINHCEYASIGFHPWVEYEAEGRMNTFAEFIDFLNSRDDVKISTFGEIARLCEGTISATNSFDC